MMKNSFLFLIPAIFFLVCNLHSSYSQVKDAGLWTNITIEKKLNKDFTLHLSEELRFNENLGELGTVFTDAGLEYKLIKNLNVSANYRFIRKKRVDDFYTTRHRWYLDALYRYKFKKMIFTLRERYQSQMIRTENDEKDISPEYYLRSKLTMRYDFDKKYRPFISFELFYQLNNPGGNQLDNLRYAAGVDYEINNIHTVDLFYIINKEINVSNPLTEYIIGIGYTLSF